MKVGLLEGYLEWTSRKGTAGLPKEPRIKISDIYDLMLNEKMFEIAYHKLKSNPGNMTPGISPTTLDGISTEVFKRIIESLRDESFQFDPGRKVNIPKGSGEEAKRNPEYRKLEYLRTKALKAGENQKANDQLKLMQKIPARLPNDPNFRRMYIVRYADDWVISIRGPLTETKDILSNINKFLRDNLKLELSETKTLITNPRKEPALFLGTHVIMSEHSTFHPGAHGQRKKSNES
ncbi:hypothetical protein CIB48_g4426 [Xylaria polymorpha]|nr:hypothetical protein CIB48_g4426 [Xylaria polymorpha]